MVESILLHKGGIMNWFERWMVKWLENRKYKCLCSIQECNRQLDKLRSIDNLDTRIKNYKK